MESVTSLTKIEERVKSYVVASKFGGSGPPPVVAPLNTFKARRSLSCLLNY